MKNLYIYDIEVYPNVFTLAVLSVDTMVEKVFEISERRNDFRQIFSFMNALKKRKARMVGFNNFGFDYPVLHKLMESGNSRLRSSQLNRIAYSKTSAIINGRFEDRFMHVIWDNDQLVSQIDLYKVHHFDNIARATSLKMLEFNMRANDIQDLPFEAGKPLTVDQIDPLIKYNFHDVRQTYDFYLKTIPHLEFRQKLTQMYGRNFMNHNDTKIGKDYFIMQLEKKLGEEACYTRENGRKEPRQTKRPRIHLEDIVFDYVTFKRPEFQAVLDWLNDQTIKETKGVFTEIPESTLGELANYADLKKKKGNVAQLNTVVDGLKFVFGTGGLHASIEGFTVLSDDEFVICDLDVTSYYPSLAIANGLYPEHLGLSFCSIYADMKAQRVGFAKGTPENAMLKLALNGVYGDSNNKFSPFFDPQYTMSITVNGQLLLCMLSESLMEIEGLRMIQANTDGITVLLPRAKLDEMHQRRLEWEFETGLDLEYAFYSRMFIRDVNNYLAEYEESGELKRKGTYEYNLDWNQNFSALVVPKAVEGLLIHDIPIEEFIETHDDDYDFYLRTKVPRTSKLILRSSIGDTRLQNITRYYISNSGAKLVKVMPPLPKNPDKIREIGIDKDWCVTPCNTMGKRVPKINYDYYIQSAKKDSDAVRGQFNYD